MAITNGANDRGQNWLFATIGCSGFLVSLLGLLQSWFKVDWVIQTRGPASTFGNRLLAADFVVFAVPFLLILILRRGFLARVLACLALLTSVAYLLSAVAKGATLAVFAEASVATVLVGLPVLLKANRRSGRSLVLSGLVFLVLGMLLSAGIKRGVISIPEEWTAHFGAIGKTVTSQLTAGTHPLRERVTLTETDTSSLAIRLTVWRNSLRMTREHPLLGVGLNNFQVFYPAYAFREAVDVHVLGNEEWPQAHNDYVQTVAELGVIGGLLAGWFLCRLGRSGLGLLARSGTWPIGFGCLTALVGLLVDMFFNFPLQSSISPMTAAVCAGLIASRSRNDDRREGPVPPAAVRWQVFPVFLAAACVLWGVLIEIHGVAASYCMGQVVRAREQGNWAAAIAAGTRVLKYRPRSHEALQFLSEAYYMVDRPAAAAEAAESVLKIRPYYTNALNNLALARVKTGDRAGAIRAYENVVAISPYNVDTHGAIGRLCLLEKRYHQAIEHFRMAGRLNPKDGGNDFGQGLACYHLERLEQAKEAFKQAVDKSPTAPEYRYYLGVTKMRLGDIEGASLNVEKALQIKPGWREAQMLLTRLNRLRVKHKAAGK